MLFVVYVVLLLLCNGFPWNSRKNPKKKQKKRLLVAKKKNKKGSSFLSSSPPLSSESSSFASGASSSSLARSYQRNNLLSGKMKHFPEKEFACVNTILITHHARCRFHSLPRISTPPPQVLLLFVLLLVVDRKRLRRRRFLVVILKDVEVVFQCARRLRRRIRATRFPT